MSTNRRGFLKQSLAASGVLSLAPAVPALLARAASTAAPRGPQETILVVVQLAGGNDGLNTVVPYGDDEYGRNRFSLRLTGKEVLKIDSLLGFHPKMQGFFRLHQEGHLAVVQGAGYPNPHQGHLESMQIWQTARPDDASRAQTGWLGRAIDAAEGSQEGKTLGVFLGQIGRPFALNAQKAIVPHLRSLEALKVRSMPGAEAEGDQRERLRQLAELPRAATGQPLLGCVQRGSLSAYNGGRQIEAAAAEAARSNTAYPPFYLARMLQMIAQLIRAEQGIRIYFTELGGEEPGGFDNHANQRDNHAALLEQLSESVSAFAADLRRDRLLDRVLLMTFSEFGRTVHENGRRGTDHGSAAPMFLVGGKLKGGLIGPHPKLTELENGGAKFHTDFRRVYATVLERWLGFDSRAALGGKFAPLELLAGY